MSNDFKGKCIIICAPSGSGKTSVVRYLLKTDLNLSFSISACTRKKRPNEVDGKDYYFMSVEAFKKKIENDEFVEWEEVYEDTYYGTLKSEIDRIWNEGKHVIFDVDVKGGLSLSKYFGEKAAAIFLKVPSLEELERRLKNRGTESPEKITRRIMKAKEELRYAKYFDETVINDDLERACEKIHAMLTGFLRY